MIVGNSGLTRFAIIGRPNVGKSTLFNILTRSRKALVKNQPGVTRDLQADDCEWWGKRFTIVDTGGLSEAKDQITQLIRTQVLSQMPMFDGFLFITDAKTGLHPEDKEILQLIKKTQKPFLVVVNKVDRFEDKDILLAEFYEMGVEVLPVSFEKYVQVDQMIEWMIKHIQVKEEIITTGKKITVIGKPNVGKSSLINRFVRQDRVIVSDIAGTTVDTIEIPFEFDGEQYFLVDTAGIRRPSKIKDGVEYLSVVKTEEAIRRSDLVLLMIDCTVGPTEHDARLLERVLELHKAVLVVANKLDLAQDEHDEPRKAFRDKIERIFHFYPRVPIAFVSAKKGTGVRPLLKKVQSIFDQLHFKISTSELNKFFYKTIRQAPAPVYGTKNVKFFYLTQTQQVPPSFIAFANHPQGVTPAYRRFLSKRIQDQWSLEDVPIRLFVMGGEN